MTDESSFRLEVTPVHLGLGASVIVQPPFTGTPDWYQSYAERNAADGSEGRLVTLHTFTDPWDTWEVHPCGEELVLCLEGSMTLLHQERDGRVRTITIEKGEGIVNLPGVHTADVAGPATALFITAGLGTELRPR